MKFWYLVFTENEIVFPLQPQTLAVHPKKGNLISKHFSVHSLIKT